MVTNCCRLNGCTAAVLSLECFLCSLFGCFDNTCCALFTTPYHKDYVSRVTQLGFDRCSCAVQETQVQKDSNLKEWSNRNMMSHHQLWMSIHYLHCRKVEVKGSRYHLQRRLQERDRTSGSGAAKETQRESPLMQAARGMLQFLPTIEWREAILCGQFVGLLKWGLLWFVLDYE